MKILNVFFLFFIILLLYIYYLLQCVAKIGMLVPLRSATRLLVALLRTTLTRGRTRSPLDTTPSRATPRTPPATDYQATPIKRIATPSPEERQEVALAFVTQLLLFYRHPGGPEIEANQRHRVRSSCFHSTHILYFPFCKINLEKTSYKCDF
jgi:hypothetical protein